MLGAALSGKSARDSLSLRPSLCPKEKRNSFGHRTGSLKRMGPWATPQEGGAAMGPQRQAPTRGPGTRGSASLAHCPASPACRTRSTPSPYTWGAKETSDWQRPPPQAGPIPREQMAGAHGEGLGEKTPSTSDGSIKDQQEHRKTARKTRDYRACRASLLLHRRPPPPPSQLVEVCGCLVWPQCPGHTRSPPQTFNTLRSSSSSPSPTGSKETKLAGQEGGAGGARAYKLMGNTGG